LKDTNTLEEIHKELKFVLTMFREKKTNATPPSNDAQEVWLNPRSTSREVQTWLTVKGFSEKYVKSILNNEISNRFFIDRLDCYDIFHLQNLQATRKYEWHGII